ncbi:MAG: DNA polymerase III subunit alpha, partial [Acidiferrobacterales bacterium]
ELTFELLKKCQTTALFQLESRGMKDLILRLKPDHFEEIIALVALFRPGPLQSGMVDDFIARKHGKKVVYPHPSLEHILKPTYGVILYQEQVMQIAQELSGYTLGGADLLRRAMGKKKPEEMAKQRDIFVKGAEDRGVNGKLASNIFDLIEKFAGYGFNRSHSAAYALIAYQTAYLKAHYPAAFMAAVLSADMDNTDKVVTMIAECRDMALEILPPAINQCGYEFVPISENQILYGLGAIKGLGQAAMEIILQARKEGGDFKSLFDLCKRIDSRKVNRRAFDSLIRAGALDDLGAHRATLVASLNKALLSADQHAKNIAAGQNDLFGGGNLNETVDEYIEVPEWSEEARLEGEKETLGLWLTGHPITRYEKELEQITSAKLSEVRPTESKTMIVAGMIVAIRTMQTRRGDRMAFITLDDRTGRIELAVFSDTYNKQRELLVKDTLLVVKGQVSVDDYSGGFKMAADEVFGIDEARNDFAKRLVLKLTPDKMANGFIGDLKQILAPVDKGACPVVLSYQNGNAEATLVLGDEWCISINSTILAQLGELIGDDCVRVDYK